jgi:hypothetical protein
MFPIKLFYQSKNITVLDNVLTQDECNELKLLQSEFGKGVIIDNNLSNKIEERCNEYIQQLIYLYDEESCKISTDKSHYWNKDIINPKWAIYKCNLGRKISSHFDRVTIKSVDYISLYSIILYLESSDGNTKYKEIEIEPTMGRVVIFKQDLLHEGLENKNNIKYYMRSEILYKRLRAIETKNDKHALDIFKESIKLYKQKLYDESFKMQDKAFKLSPLLERHVLCLL